MKFWDSFKAYLRGEKAFGGLDSLAKGIGLVGIIVAISLLVVSKVQANLTANTAEYNALTVTIQAIDDIPGWLGTVIVIVIGALILGYMGMFSGGKGKK